MTGKFEFSQLNKELAYLLGAYLGDGCVYTNKNGWKQFTLEVIDRDFAEYAQQCINKLTGIDKDIYVSNRNNDREYYKAYTGNQELCKLLQEITGSKSYFPKLIKYSDKFLQQEFISGLFDSEGWVDNHSWLKVGIASTSIWILELRDLLDELGANISKIRRRENGGIKPLWSIHIPTKNIRKVGLRFKIKRKQERLDNYFKSSQTERMVSRKR